MIMQIKSQKNNIQFQGFAKFKANHHEAKHLANKVKKALPDSFVFWDKKNNQKRTYFILTGKHQDKFMSLIEETEFYNLKENIEKYMNEKAKKISLKKLYKKLENGKLTI